MEIVSAALFWIVLGPCSGGLTHTQTLESSSFLPRSPILGCLICPTAVRLKTRNTAVRERVNKNNFRNSIILGLFRPNNHRQFCHTFAAVHPLPKCIGKLVFEDGWDYPITACLKNIMGQREDSQVWFCTRKRKKSIGWYMAKRTVSRSSWCLCHDLNCRTEVAVLTGILSLYRI